MIQKTPFQNDISVQKSKNGVRTENLEELKKKKKKKKKKKYKTKTKWDRHQLGKQ